MEEQLKKIRERVEFLEAQRKPWDAVAQDVAKYVTPALGCWKDQDRSGDTHRMRAIIDPSGLRAWRMLGAGLQSGLSSPARSWFRLSLPDKELMEFGPVRTWLDDVEKLMYFVFATSNFYQASHTTYLEIGAFGSACLFAEEHPEHHLHFTPMTFGEYAWGTDGHGNVDSVARRSRITARGLEQRFGKESLSDKARKLLEKRPFEFVEIVQYVGPRDNRDPDKIDSGNMPFQSLYYEADANEDLLAESGYRTSPILCPRWFVTGADVYGWGPGLEVLPDVKMLQELAKNQLMAIHLATKPPMRVPANFNKRLKMIPGGQTPVSQQNPDGVAPLFTSRLDIASVSQKIEDVRNAIREGFFNDLFLMIWNSRSQPNQATATQIMEMQEEKMIMLGPVVERLAGPEFLDPLITRVYSVLENQGRLPEPPEEIKGQALKVDYISPLAQAQKMVGMSSMQNLLGVVAQVAQAHPQVTDKIDWDQVVDETALMLGAPASILVPDETVAQKRAQAEQQAQQQQAMQQAMAAMQAIPKGVKDLAAASTDSPNALTGALGSLMGGLGGAQGAGDILSQAGGAQAAQLPPELMALLSPNQGQPA